jgi:hypothetical protein
LAKAALLNSSVRAPTNVTRGNISFTSGLLEVLKLSFKTREIGAMRHGGSDECHRTVLRKCIELS